MQQATVPCTVDRIVGKDSEDTFYYRKCIQIDSQNLFSYINSQDEADKYNDIVNLKKSINRYPGVQTFSLSF